MSSPTVINEEYDIVIAGGEPTTFSSTFFLLTASRPIMTGGTAACVVASRLAVADTNLRVLLLEAGPTTYNNPVHTVPLNGLVHVAPGSRTVRAHVSHPSAALGGRPAIVQSGQCLGGGGSMNCASRPSPLMCAKSLPSD